MDPNQQPREDSNNQNEPQFGAPEQANSPVDTPVSSPVESPVSPSEVTPSQEPVESQPFGQPTEPVQPPTPEVAPASPEAAPAAPQQPVAHGENPGQTLGIISIVLSFVGLSVVGIILGVISRKKSKEANAPTTLGTVGLVIGIVTTVLAVLSFVFFMILVSIGMAAEANNPSSGSFDSSYSDSYYSE